MCFFIVGCGRSGTTLLRVLLNRHPDIAIPLESLFIVDYLRYQGPLNHKALVGLMLNEPELDEWRIDLDKDSLYSAGSMDEVVRRLHRQYADAYGKTRWGQKTPRFVRRMDLLLETFPKSRFIHLVRDPRAVVNSLMQSNAHFNNPLTGSRRWLKDVRAGIDFEQRHPDEVLRLKYEDLVLNPEQCLRQVCRHLDLAWPHDGWWEEERKEREEYSSFYDQIHENLDRPILTDPLVKWKNQLDNRGIAVIEKLAGDTMSRLSYQPSSEEPGVGLNYMRWLMIEQWWGLSKRVAQYLRKRRRYLWYVPYRKWRLGLLGEMLGGSL